MSLSFLPQEILMGLSHLNINFVTEIRIRQGQPVIIGYRDEYYYLDRFGLSLKSDGAIIAGEIVPIISAATNGSIYSYAEQMRNGFITCVHGVRIGLAGEYITQNGLITSIANITSLNIRIPHEAVGCSEYICNNLFSEHVHSTIIFSKPGLGKTTKLRDIARYTSDKLKLNVLIFDERNEIAAMDFYGNGFYVGERTDVVRSGNKLTAFESAIRAMKPDIIITDELYGEDDIKAVKYLADCGIKVIASTHITDSGILKTMPFEYFVELKTLLGQPIIYDKNFATYSRGGADNIDRDISVCPKKEKNAGIFRTL